MSKAIHQIIDRPLVTEKSVQQSQAGRYTFKCRTDANKIEIRRAVEEFYDVRVSNVNTLIVKGHIKKVGRRRPGRTADWKKAIVTLTPDSKPTRLKEIFEGA
jgi:large subunit ribosomal protein L23